jgi:D-tyrosyl-tRNA(Tyr) deacylase
LPQFTLAADTRKGLRPSFTSAAPPEWWQRLFEHAARPRGAKPGPPASRAGRFGAHMLVALVNDGPVTFWLAFDTECNRGGLTIVV